MSAREHRIACLRLAACGIDPRRLTLGRMVFPQNEHSVGIVGELLPKCQRTHPLVDKTRCARCRVDGNGRHGGECFGALPAQRAQQLVESLGIVRGMLPELRLRSVAILAAAPPAIRRDGRSELAPVDGIDQ